MKNFTLLLLIACLGFSCGDTFDEAEQLAEDTALIEAYLAENNRTAQKTDSGLHYEIIVEGTGEHPDVTNTVQCSYEGKLMETGFIFDATVLNETREFGLNGVIEGWREGIPLLKRNGRGIFYVPSKLAYGNREQNGIPKNSVLIFDVSLMHFW